MDSNELSKLSLTDRDYISIFEDLRSAIPDVSQIWNSNDESDPGIVLVKLMSMLGDMLSYNQDKQALEVFPETVTQRKNAAQIYRLIGYKMHWYRSARCNVTLTNTNPSPATVPRFTRFTTKDENITYTNIQQIELPSNTSDNGLEYTLDLIQGIPRTPSKVNGEIIPNPGDAWHTIYNYNVLASDIIQNRIYLDDQNVDESSILLVDDFNEEWIQVDNVDVMTATGKYFELRVDEYDKPYLQIVNYWDRFDVSRFKLFYILSDGINGQITNNALVKATTSIVSVTGTSENTSIIDISDDIVISNRESTYGYDPETPDEARKESAKYINTYDTLVTLDDFTRAVSRMDGVAKCIALDCTNDPDPDLDSYVVKIYIVRTPEFEDADPSSYKEMINTNIAEYKLMPLKIIVDLESIMFVYWTVSGEVYLKEPVSIDKAQDILVKINNQLSFDYDPQRIEFNSTMRFIDVIHSIESADPLIDYVDINPITYEDEEGQPVDQKTITGKYVESIPPNPPESGNFTYDFTLLQHPVKPGTVSIRIDGGTYVVSDNGNGKMINSQGFLNESGTIDYNTGHISFTSSVQPNSDLVISYTKNVISMARYINFNVNDFTIANESIKR